MFRASAMEAWLAATALHKLDQQRHLLRSMLDNVTMPATTMQGF
jgi:hypothetical protein